jgi:hypothetical protein
MGLCLRLFWPIFGLFRVQREVLNEELWTSNTDVYLSLLSFISRQRWVVAPVLLELDTESGIAS